MEFSNSAFVRIKERTYIMKVSKKKVSDITVEELKAIMHDVITEDFETFRETMEIMANKKLIKQIKQADEDWIKGKKDTYVSWDEIKSV